MNVITVSRAIEFVRKNLDEIGFNTTDLIDNDNNDLNEIDTLIMKLLPESINAVHRVAAPGRLEGVRVNEYEKIVADGCVITFAPKVTDFLRMVRFRADDTPITIARLVDETSAEGRMQHNRFTRGTWNNPRLVHKTGRLAYPEFVYYQLKEEPAEESIKALPCAFDESHIDHYETDLFTFEYIPEQRFSPSAIRYLVADGLDQAVLDNLTGYILQIYKENDQASVFINRAVAALQ